MHFVIFDTGHDLAFRTAGFFANSEVLKVSFHPDRELRITKGTSVLVLDESSVTPLPNVMLRHMVFVNLMFR
jgi:hypothetical protein